VTHRATPYEDHVIEEWLAVTEELLARHPLTPEQIVGAVRRSWAAIFESNIGTLRIGTAILPLPQIMSFFLHELIPVELSKMDSHWRRGAGQEKDAYYTEAPQFSFEIKASSHIRDIFGNRSYAQVSGARGKDKSGYYLTVNFEKFKGDNRPQLTRVRFGWLDHTDWIGQTSQTGQQAHLSANADRYKLVDLL